MSFDSVVVGVAKCPNTKQLYGVRIEIEKKVWTATWAFPIKERIAKREGYAANQFPPDLKYSKEFPGCPYCEKYEDLAKISQAKKIRPKKIEMSVSERGCDDIGSILSSMRINYSAYSTLGFKCNILFINCLTSDYFDSDQLRDYVNDGGCLYASCYADEILKSAFPGIFISDHSGVPHSEYVSVEDPELRSVVGDRIAVRFDTPWAKLYSAEGSKCILKSTETSLPIMVSLKYGKGIIFFTCFHNHVQASEKEQALLQLLVLKQIGTNKNMTINEAGAALGIDVDAIKAKFRTNF